MLLSCGYDADEDAFTNDDEDDAQDGASEVPVQVDGAGLLPSDCSDWQYICADEVDEEEHYCYSASSCDETSSVGSDASIISISSSISTISSSSSSSNGTGAW